MFKIKVCPCTCCVNECCFRQNNRFVDAFDKLLWQTGQTHYKMISCNIWLPVVIHRSKTRNNALDVFWGIETIIMPLSRQPQKKSFCPVSHSLAPTFMKIFFIMRLPCYGRVLSLHKNCVNIQKGIWNIGKVSREIKGFSHRLYGELAVPLDACFNIFKI